MINFLLSMEWDKVVIVDKRTLLSIRKMSKKRKKGDTGQHKCRFWKIFILNIS